MIRLLLTVASAAAVVWFVGSRPDALTPEPEQARRVIERAARVVGEAVEVAGARAADALAPEGAAATAPAAAEEPAATDEVPAIRRPAPAVVAAERDFGPESAETLAPPSGAARTGAARTGAAQPGGPPAGDTLDDAPSAFASGFDAAGPLDAQGAALVRERLDRVMALAAGPAR